MIKAATNFGDCDPGLESHRRPTLWRTKLGFLALLNDVIEIELSIIILILFNYPSKSLLFQAQAEEAEATDAQNEATLHSDRDDYRFDVVK